MRPLGGPARSGQGAALTLLGFEPAQLAWIGLTALVAFVVRGVSGFGSSMVGIGSLSILLPPVQVVPAFLALELLTTVHLLPGVWRQVDWRSLRWLIGGAMVATPLGLLLLAGLDPNPMRLFVSLCLLSISLLMLSGLAQRLAPKQTPGPLGALAAGAASGVLNGAAGIGGPPAIVFYFATTGAAISRATLIAYFLFTDVWALAWAGGKGLLTSAAGPLIIVALPFSLAGIWLGQRLYLRLDEAQLRRLIWLLLALLGALGVGSAGLQLLRWSGDDVITLCSCRKPLPIESRQQPDRDRRLRGGLQQLATCCCRSCRNGGGQQSGVCCR